MSVAGNQYFTRIENAAGQLNYLTTASGSLNLENLNLGVGTLGTGGRTLYTAVGYAPTTFATTAAAGVVNLNVSANLAATWEATMTAMTARRVMVSGSGDGMVL